MNHFTQQITKQMHAFAQHARTFTKRIPEFTKRIPEFAQRHYVPIGAANAGYDYRDSRAIRMSVPASVLSAAIAGWVWPADLVFGVVSAAADRTHLFTN